MAEDIGSLFHDNERRLRNIESRGRIATPNYETFRNLFINGDFEVDQRNSGAAQTITAGAALAYTVDRWFAYSVGSNATGQRITSSTTDRYIGTPNRFTYRLTGASGNTNVYFGQRIEAVNAHHLAGQKATLQADIVLSSALSRNITWVAYYATTTDTFGTVASPTKVEFARGQWSVRDAIKNYTATFDVPTAAVTGIEIIFIIPSLSASQTVSFADVQFEAGPNPSPFEHRHFGAELALCQRYYQRIAPSNTVTMAFGHVQSGTTERFTVPISVSLRTTPALTATGSYTSVGSNGAFALSSFSVRELESNTVVIEAVSATGHTSGALIMFGVTGNVLAFDSEL